MTTVDASRPGLLAGAAEQPSSVGWGVRATVALLLVVAVLLPVGTVDLAQACSLAAIYAIAGVSLNVVIGYTGQLSLGHQGFLGLGALTAANVVSRIVGKALSAPPLWAVLLSLLAAVVASALAALGLGIVALRIRGLYLALITLVFGLAIASSLFQLGSLTNNGSGVNIARPSVVNGNGSFYAATLIGLALVVYVDVCLLRSKVGRALLALREDERVASAFGIPVTRYKLIAFGMSGAMVGLAGGLFSFRTQAFAAQNFNGQAGLNLALLFVVMVVVGGLGDRLGVIVAAAFFGLIDKLLDLLFLDVGFLKDLLQHVPLLNAYYGTNKGSIAGAIGALLLLQTIVFNPAGVGGLAHAVATWLRGGRFELHAKGGSGPRPVEGSAARA